MEGGSSYNDDDDGAYRHDGAEVCQTSVLTYEKGGLIWEGVGQQFSHCDDGEGLDEKDADGDQEARGGDADPDGDDDDRGEGDCGDGDLLMNLNPF